MNSNNTPTPVAIITGAGSGVGRATALALAHQGYALALLGRTPQTLADTKTQIQNKTKNPAEILTIPTDVTRSADVQHAITQTLQQLGRIDALVNAAGSAPLQPLEKITDDALDDCLAVNLKSVIYTTRAAWPTFQQQQSGVIVNVSSMASIDPFTGFNIYAAAKAGVNLFTQATADEGAPHHIRAYALAPGAIETPMLRRLFSTDDLPKNKTLQPADVAQPILDMLLNQTQTPNGQTQILPSP